MATNLSQDLPDDINVDTIDILGDDLPAETGGDTDIIPETEPEVKSEAEPEVKPEEEKKEEPKEEKKEELKEKAEEKVEEKEISLDDILGKNEEIKDGIDNVVKETEEIKDTIEDAKEAFGNDDQDVAEKLIDELYSQVIDYSTKVDTLSTKNDILQTKLTDLTNSNTDYELQLAQASSKSSDPKVLVINRMYDGAVAGEDFSKTKVISTLEDMYYDLTGKSFDETRVDKVSDKNAEKVVLNELTPPAVKEEPEEEVNLNDITSIF